MHRTSTLTLTIPILHIACLPFQTGLAYAGTTSVTSRAGCIAALRVRIQQQAQVALALGTTAKYLVSGIGCCDTPLCNIEVISGATRAAPSVLAALVIGLLVVLLMG